MCREDAHRDEYFLQIHFICRKIKHADQEMRDKKAESAKIVQTISRQKNKIKWRIKANEADDAFAVR